MQNVRQSILEKQKNFEIMQKSMSEATNRNVNNNIKLIKMETEKNYKSEVCNIKLGDCVQLIKEVPDESVYLG